MSESVINPTDPPVSPEDDAPAAPTDDSKDSGGGLRKQLEAVLVENRGLKADKRNDILTSIGLNPETGLGKALAEKFDAGDVTIENLADVATNEYGHVPPEGHPQALQIAQGQAELDKLQQTGGSVIPPTEVDALAKAEAEGDYATTMAIKGQQMADMLRRGR